MIKILVANEDTEQISNCSKFLMKNNFEIYNSANGYSTIETYKKIEPNILILDSNMSDIKYTDIIDKITDLPFEKNKCNIFLTINNPQQILSLENTIKIHQIFHTPVNYQKLLEEINIMKDNLEFNELSEVELNFNLLKLNISPRSKGGKYLKSAIWKYYYYSNEYDYLDEVLAAVASENNVSDSQVRESIRNALKPFNKYSSNIDNKFVKMLDFSRNITPKYFIEFFSEYLKIQNIK